MTILSHAVLRGARLVLSQIFSVAPSFMLQLPPDESQLLAVRDRLLILLILVVRVAGQLVQLLHALAMLRRNLGRATTRIFWRYLPTKVCIICQ